MSATPTDAEISAMSPAQATAALERMSAEFRGAPASGTAAAAAAELDALMANREWSKRYMEGGAAERAKFGELTTRIAAGDSVAEIAAGKAEPLSIETTAGDELPSHTMHQAVADLRAKGFSDANVGEILDGQLRTGAGRDLTAAETAARVADADRALDTLMRNPEFRKDLLVNHPEAKARFDWLTGIIAIGRQS